MKSLLIPFVKSFSLPLGLTAVTNAAIQKKISGSGVTSLIFLNKELSNVVKIDTFFKNSGVLINGVSKTVAKKVKNQKRIFLGMFTVTLGPSLLGNMLAGNWEQGVIRANKGAYIYVINILNTISIFN